MAGRVTVFGASGFVGQNLLVELSSSDVEINAVDIKPLNVKTSKNLVFIGADILDEQHMLDVTRDVDIIVHLATSSLRTSLHNPRRNVRINVEGMINILEAARKNDVRKIIYSSASSVYGIPKYLPVDEEHPKNPTTVYGVTKYTGESLIRVYHSLYGIDYFIFRFTNVYGPYQYPESGGIIPVVMSRILNGDEVIIYGDGSQSRDFVYVGDLVRLIREVIENKTIKNETVNAGTGKNTTILDVVEYCGKVLNLKPKIVFKEREGGERKAFQADMRKCKKIFGWIPSIPLEVGLRKTAIWIKDYMKSKAVL